MDNLIPAPTIPPLANTTSWVTVSANGTEDVELRDAWTFLARNRLLIAVVTAIALAVGIGVVKFMTPVYESTASLRIDEATPQFAAITIPGLDVAGPGATLLTDIETLRSRTLAAALIDSFALRVAVSSPSRATHADIIESAVAPADAAGRYKLKAAPGRNEWRLGGAAVRLAAGAAAHQELELEVTPLDVAIDRLQEALSIKRRRGDVNVVDVSFRSTDRTLARDIPNALTASFVADRLAAQRAHAHGTAEFLRSQIARMAVQLDSAENALRSFRETERVISPEQQAGAEVQNAAQLRAQRDALAAEAAALAALLAGGGNYRELVAFPSLLRNQAVSGLLTSLATVEDRRSELLVRRNTTDPDVQLLTDRAAAIEAQLGAMARAYQRGLQGQAATLDSALRRSEAQMRYLPAREVRLARLQREATVLEEIYTQMQTRLKEAEIGEAANDPSVRVLDAAVLPREPVAPRTIPYLAVALVIGLLLSISIAAVREYADHSVHTRRDISRTTSLPVLAMIPRAARPRTHRLPRNAQPNSREARPSLPALWVKNGATSLADAYDRFQVNLAFTPGQNGIRVVTMTSPAPREGKTTSAVNLAATLARRVTSVLLVDGDVRRGVIARLLDVQQQPGLTEVLSGQADLADVLQTVRLDDGTELTVLSSGQTPADPARLLGSEAMRNVLARLRDMFDAVVIDAPPVNLMTDAALLGSLSDGVVVVARSGTTSQDELREAVEHLHAVRARLLGVVLNDVDFEHEYGYDRAYAGYRRAYTKSD